MSGIFELPAAMTEKAAAIVSKQIEDWENSGKTKSLVLRGIKYHPISNVTWQTEPPENGVSRDAWVYTKAFGVQVGGIRGGKIQLIGQDIDKWDAWAEMVKPDPPQKPDRNSDVIGAEEDWLG